MEELFYNNGSSLLGTRARTCETAGHCKRITEVEVSAVDMTPWQRREMDGKRISFYNSETKWVEAEVELGDDFNSNKLTIRDPKNNETYSYVLHEWETSVSLGDAEIDVEDYYDRNFDSTYDE